MHLEENNHLLHDFAEVLKLLHAGIVNVILKQQLVSIKIAESLSKRELELARKIHEKSISEIPNLPFNVKVSSFLKAAQHVGGDWLAVYSHPHLGLVNFYIGDVTGHGLDSAFLVSTVAGAVKMSERELEAGALRLPGEINFLATNYLKDLYHNLDALVKEATEQKQMTFAAGILDTSSGQLYFLNAGHLPPLFLNSAQESLLSFQNGPLGDGSHRHETEIKVTKLQPNQALVFYTDGLLENLQHSLQKLGAKKLHKKMNEIYATQNGDLHDFAEKVYNWTIAQNALVVKRTCASFFKEEGGSHASSRVSGPAESLSKVDVCFKASLNKVLVPFCVAHFPCTVCFGEFKTQALEKFSLFGNRRQIFECNMMFLNWDGCPRLRMFLETCSSGFSKGLRFC